MDDAGQLHAVSDHLPTLKGGGGLRLFYGASLRFYSLIVPDGFSRLSIMRR